MTAVTQIYLRRSKSPRIRWYRHDERMQNQIISLQIATSRMEGTTKKGRPRKRGRVRVKRT
jgi:hypothetical protein